jgi:hypothetical protein|tara:strand:- start:252 stop:383 length:132 start_codon:yes stop_codon:yes gene_type:complete
MTQFTLLRQILSHAGVILARIEQSGSLCPAMMQGVCIFFDHFA